MFTFYRDIFAEIHEGNHAFLKLQMISKHQVVF